MKFLLCIVVLATVVAMATSDKGFLHSGINQVIPILKDDRTQNGYGEYTFEFETDNGISRYETGRESEGQVKEGGWRYISPEGVPVQITFVADQGGYQPQGDLLPIAPPLPYQRTDVFVH